MYIKELSLSNFKSFRGSDNHFIFSKHINYFVGNNNAGKSTVLEAIDFVRNQTSDPEKLRSLNPDGSDFFVEMTLAGNDIEKLIDASQNTDAKAKTIKSCIYHDNSSEDTGEEELLTVRRFFGEGDDTKRIAFLENGDENADERSFSNKTGIDAPFKSIFNPTLFRATDNPDTILDFSSTHLLGKIVGLESKGFFDSSVWSDFKNAHDKAFTGKDGYRSQLDSLKNELSKRTQEQFGKKIAISFEFDTPDAVSFIKMGKTHVDDGIADTEISEKGNGLQRAIAFALIRVYAEKLREVSDDPLDNPPESSPGLFLCVDEPEIWMHPRAQLQLAEALSSISEKEQVWVSTHSPYLLKKYNQVGDGTKLFIFNDISATGHMSFSERINDSQHLGVIACGEPSLAEITYKAFQIATIEYHNELFGTLQILENKPSILNMDQLFADKYHCQKKYKRIDSRYLKGHSNKIIAEETLPVHIRNLIDHPEAIALKKQCLAKYRTEAQKPYDDKELESLSNTFTDVELRESIDLMEGICSKLRE